VCQIDWDDLATNLLKLETDCRTSWNHLHTLEKHDSAMVSKNRYAEHCWLSLTLQVGYLCKLANEGWLLCWYMHLSVALTAEVACCKVMQAIICSEICCYFIMLLRYFQSRHHYLQIETVLPTNLPFRPASWPHTEPPTALCISTTSTHQNFTSAAPNIWNSLSEHLSAFHCSGVGKWVAISSC